MTREPARIPVTDPEVERAIDEVRRAVIELARDPFISGRDIEVTLPNAELVTVRHGLGRRFANYTLSAPMGATTSGRIVESAPDADRLAVKLTATGYGATITIRLRIW